jgi:hypothetical protein
MRTTEQNNVYIYVTFELPAAVFFLGSIQGAEPAAVHMCTAAGISGMAFME